MLKLDVTKRKEIDDLNEQLADKTIDILYLNAGATGSRRSIPFGELESPEWEEVLRVSSVAPLNGGAETPSKSPEERNKNDRGDDQPDGKHRRQFIRRCLHLP